MEPITTHTKFGMVVRHTDVIAVIADNVEIHDWVHRPGASWPCSTLIDYDNVCAWFDKNGLTDLQAYRPRDTFDDDYDCYDTENIAGDELTAWTNDVIREAELPKDHPAYAVTLGQEVT